MSRAQLEAMIEADLTRKLRQVMGSRRICASRPASSAVVMGSSR